MSDTNIPENGASPQTNFTNLSIQKEPVCCFSGQCSICHGELQPTVEKYCFQLEPNFKRSRNEILADQYQEEGMEYCC